MLELLRERAFPAREIVPFASERSVGRELDGGLIVQGLSEEAIQGFDLALFSAGGSTSGEWAPRFADAGAIGDRQLLALAHAGRRPAGRQRGQPRRARGPPRDHRQPELLDDADGRRAEAAARRGRDRAARDQHLPGRLGHRPACGRRAARPVARPAARARDRAARAQYAHQIAFNALPHAGSFADGRRPHRRGAQADERDAQDPRRPVDPHQRHVRARAGRHGPLRGRQRADPRRALARARARAAAPQRRA